MNQSISWLRQHIAKALSTPSPAAIPPDAAVNDHFFRSRLDFSFFLALLGQYILFMMLWPVLLLVLAFTLAIWFFNFTLDSLLLKKKEKISLLFPNIPRARSKMIRRKFGIPRIVALRASDDSDLSARTMPFGVHVILIPRTLLQNNDLSGQEARFMHEQAHWNIEWFLTFYLGRLALFIHVLMLLPYWLGAFDSFFTNPVSNFGLLCSGGILLIFSMLRMEHIRRGELSTDYRSFLRMGDDYLVFLERSARRERYIKKEGFWKSLKKNKFHPKMSERYSSLVMGGHFSALRLFLWHTLSFVSAALPITLYSRTGAYEMMAYIFAAIFVFSLFSAVFTLPITSEDISRPYSTNAWDGIITLISFTMAFIICFTIKFTMDYMGMTIDLLAAIEALDD